MDRIAEEALVLLVRRLWLVAVVAKAVDQRIPDVRAAWFAAVRPG